MTTVATSLGPVQGVRVAGGWEFRGINHLPLNVLPLASVKEEIDSAIVELRPAAGAPVSRARRSG